jgi:hypothetical protein
MQVLEDFVHPSILPGFEPEPYQLEVGFKPEAVIASTFKGLQRGLIELLQGDAQDRQHRKNVWRCRHIDGGQLQSRFLQTAVWP